MSGACASRISANGFSRDRINRRGSPKAPAARQGFGDMDAADRVLPIKVGNGAGHTQDAVVGSGGQRLLQRRLLQQGFAGAVRRGHMVEMIRRQMGIQTAALDLGIPGLGHAPGRLRCALDRRRQGEVGRRDRWYLDLQINPIQHRPRYPGLIIRRAARATAACRAFTIPATTATGIHRGHQLEPCRVSYVGIGPRDGNRAGFQRLTQTVEYLRMEFGQFVQKKNAVMGQRRLAGSGPTAAADHGRH